MSTNPPARIPHTYGDVHSSQTKAIGQLQRRPPIRQASDLLGPGFGPTATLIQDWNDDQTAFNGFFYSIAPSVHNGPDATVSWAGITIAEVDGTFGVQRVWASHTSSPDIPREYYRTWRDPSASGIRSYTAWTGSTDWATTGITVFADCTITSQQWRLDGRTVFMSAHIVLTTTITVGADGNVGNHALLQMPLGAIPGGTMFQALSGGPDGPVTTWHVEANTGKVYLDATSPGATLTSGTLLAVGGSYSI